MNGLADFFASLLASLNLGLMMQMAHTHLGRTGVSRLGTVGQTDSSPGRFGMGTDQFWNDLVTLPAHSAFQVSKDC